MSPITKITIIGVLILAGLLLFLGCGSSTPNSNSTFNSDTEQHTAGWLPLAHKTAAKADESGCAECHGSDYLGGIAGVSCSKCHLGGTNAVHPADWGTKTSIKHAAYVKLNGNTSCANTYCHGSSLTGVTDSGASCTSCHLGGVSSVHPTDWGTNIDSLHGAYVSANGSSSCANAACHGSNLAGVTDSGPSCTSCHSSTTSTHPAWGSPTALKHAPYVNANGTGSCANGTCHGIDLKGVSGSGPSCTLCHIGSAILVHPSNWTAPAFKLHSFYVQVNTANSCKNNYCHGSALTGVTESGPSCTSCHLGGAYSVHPASWATSTLPLHGVYATGNGLDSCKNTACHGTSLQGVVDSGMACAACHNSNLIP